MISVKRHPNNPILMPVKHKKWEAKAAFNGSPLKESRNKYHLFYRALGEKGLHMGSTLELSTIGHAISRDGINFFKRAQLMKPKYDWDKFGLEDPRATEFEGKYYIFYTALSTYPFKPEGIKVGVAIAESLEEIKGRYLVTPFNAKAMTLFPQRINGKMTAILTVNPDLPPAKIALASFNDEEEMCSIEFWDEWLKNLDSHSIDLQRSVNDHIEVGAPPLKTKKGWLLIYSYIRNYKSGKPFFGIEAVLLDIDNPFKIIGRTKEAILAPQKNYELFGEVKNVVFPSGALIEDGNLNIYYGGADTCCGVACVNLEELLTEMTKSKHKIILGKEIEEEISLIKYAKNPILKPIAEHNWENKYILNAGAIYAKNKVHILYRAMGDDDTSVLGYASSRNGFEITERPDKPAYIPRESFETKKNNGFSGCEDPRITRFGNKYYMCYTAYNGVDPTRVALTSISISDFHKKIWNWSKPILVSPPGENDKNACLLPEKINNRYVFFHRLEGSIWIDYVKDLKFENNQWLGGEILMHPRFDKWDSEKIGIGPPPFKIESGWLLIYHALTKEDKKYRLGAAILDLAGGNRVIKRFDYPIMEPDMPYEYQGYRPATVFSCGAVLIDETLFIYYGAGDTVTCVSTVPLEKLLKAF